MRIAQNNKSAIEKLDKNNMLALLLGLDKQCLHAKVIGESFSAKNVLADGVKNIVFTGMGGSAIGGDLIRSYTAHEINVPVIVNRNYTLPDFVDNGTLLFASSYSGDTEETLSAYKEAREKNVRIIAISSNGTLEKLARKDRVPLIQIPGGLSPRCALAYSFIPPILVLGKLGFIGNKSKDISETAEVLKGLKGELAPESAGEANLSKKIAERLQGRFPIIYGSNDYIDAVLTRWRCQLAENGKHLASTHVFPEMNHNEIAGWDFPAELMERLAVVFLRDNGDHKRVAVRMDITKDLLAKKGIETIEVRSRGKGVLSRMMSLIFIGDMASFYLAILNGIDPTPVDRVTYMKKELAKVCSLKEV